MLRKNRRDAHPEKELTKRNAAVAQKSQAFARSSLFPSKALPDRVMSVAPVTVPVRLIDEVAVPGVDDPGYIQFFSAGVYVVPHHFTLPIITKH